LDHTLATRDAWRVNAQPVLSRVQAALVHYVVVSDDFERTSSITCNPLHNVFTFRANAPIFGGSKGIPVQQQRDRRR
jgi:hypothetical protein